MPGCDIRSSDKTSLHCTEPCKETSITEAIITIVNVNVISPCRPRVVPNCHGLGIASLCMGTCGRRFRRARFHQIEVFLGEIVAYLELDCVATLLASLVQLQRRRKRESKKKATG